MQGGNESSSSYQPFSSGSHDGASHEDNGNALCPCHSYHHNSDEASVKPMKCNWDIELLEFLLESFFCLFIEQDCCQVPSQQQQQQQQQQHPHHPHYPRDYRQQEQHDYRQQGQQQQQQQQQLPSQEGPPKDDDSYFFEGQPSSIKQGQAGDDDDGKRRAKLQPQNEHEAQDDIHMSTTGTCYDGCGVSALPQ